MLRLFPGRNDAAKLLARMVGLKIGDRFAQVGCANGDYLGAVAAGVGLSGRAAVFVPDASAAARAQKGAAAAGVLVEVEVSPPMQLKSEAAEFDVVVVDDTKGLLTSLSAEDRVGMVRELFRILRPGGRVMVVGSAARGGLGALLGQSGPPFDPVPSLNADGFKSARTLAERDGFRFFEALKPRSA